MKRTSIGSFQGVINLYTSITPLRGQRASEDIRPIEERRYWWRRIKKYDDNCYALLDGDYVASRTSEQYEKDMAPYLWTRDPETGDEFVRIRNGAGNYAHTSRYEFLRTHAPSGMWFEMDSCGRQYMDVRIGADRNPHPPFSRHDYTRFPLPKSTHMWEWQTKSAGEDDESYLLFKVLGGYAYERVGKEVSRAVTTIDKALKKQWKPTIEEFYQYLGAVAPMLNTDWASLQIYSTNISEWMKEHPIHGKKPAWASHWVSYPPEALAKEIISTPDHELRPSLVALVANEINLKRSSYNAKDMKDIRSRYNRFMNKLINLYEQERG